MHSDRSKIYRERAADCLLKASILSQTDEWRRVAKVWETLASMHEDMPAISVRAATQKGEGHGRAQTSLS